MNRRKLLLGGLGVVGLAGCSAHYGLSGLTSSPKSPKQEAKLDRCSYNHEGTSRLKWYFDEQVAVILTHSVTYRLDNPYRTEGDFAFIYEYDKQPSFAKLPIELLNKGYLDFNLPLITGDICGEVVDLQANGGVVGNITFAKKELTAKEIALLKSLMGEDLWSVTLSKPKDAKYRQATGTYYRAVWQVGSQPEFNDTLELNKVIHFDERHVFFGQKIYCIHFEFAKSRLYSQSFDVLFDDDNDMGVRTPLWQHGVYTDKKALWESQNQVSKHLLDVVDGQVVYKGRVLKNRLDVLARLDGFGQLEKPFGWVSK